MRADKLGQVEARQCSSSGGGGGGGGGSSSSSSSGSSSRSSSSSSSKNNNGSNNRRNRTNIYDNNNNNSNNKNRKTINNPQGLADTPGAEDLLRVHQAAQRHGIRRLGQPVHDLHLGLGAAAAGVRPMGSAYKLSSLDTYTGITL